MKTKLLLSILVVLMTFGVLSAAPDRPLGDSRVFATVPAVPGFPEGIAVRGKRVYVTGPANFGIFTPSVVLAYNRKTGNLERTFPITLQDPDPAVMKGLSPCNFGPDGKLYAPEPFMGVVLRLDLDKNNTQSVYAGPFPAPGPGTSLLNELVFDAAGNLYVTDSFQATIFRVPPGGGVPEVWFTDPRLAGDPECAFRGERHPHRQEDQAALRLGNRRERHPGRRDLPAAPGGQPHRGQPARSSSLPVSRSRPGRAARTGRDRLGPVGQDLRSARGHEPDLGPAAEWQRGGALLGAGGESRGISESDALGQPGQHRFRRQGAQAAGDQPRQPGHPDRIRACFPSSTCSWTKWGRPVP